MNILFYSPLQSRSKDTESVMEGLVNSGDKVFLLTHYRSEVYHNACTKLGVQCFSTEIEGTQGIKNKIKQIFFLVRFCLDKEIEIVYSQLEPANLIAVFAQFFMKAKVVLFRHHIDEIETSSTKRAHALSILTYKLAKSVVVVSRRAKEYMIDKERIMPDKITFIPLGYNFSLWPSISEDLVHAKKQQLNTKLTLITAARLVKAKRVDLCIILLSRLLGENIDCKLLILGEGEDSESLKTLLGNLGVRDRVIFEGYVSNVLDYMLAADVMVHFSLIDSSPAIVKEAGLAKKPVVVCRDVGDCDDYIIDGLNGFLVDRNHPVEEAYKKIIAFYHNERKYRDMGNQLYESVMMKFSIETVLPLYQKLNKELMGN